jgi:DNA repair exonuclease SbcCD nuclease subunit
MRAADPNPVIAILCSDIHLSERAPIARAVGQDWFTVQKRYLDQLRELKEKHNAILIVAGDVFDYWKSSPELINFAIVHMPECYAVPGQHDLPNHNYNDLHKSAYWTLVEAKIIKHLDPYIKIDVPDSRLRIAIWFLSKLGSQL